MTQVTSARLLPQKPSRWAKSLLNRKVPIFLFFLLELTFLVFSYLSLQEHFPSIILWEHLLSVFTFFYLLNRSMDSRSKLSWLIIIALFPIFGTALLYFSLADLGVRRLKKRLEDATVQASDHLSTNPEVADYLSQSDRQLQKLAYFLEHSPAQFPIYRDTEVTYFLLGDDMLPALLEVLKKAERYIFMEYFIIQEGTMWNTILDVLEEKAKEGVDVRVIYDDMGCILTLPTGYEKTLREKGIQCQIFNPFIPILSSHFNTRDHRKICVIDGNVGFTGGINLADEYINEKEKHGHWKDTAVLLRGQGVQGLTEMFLELWQFTCQEKLHLCDFLPNESFLAPGFVQPYGDSPLDSCNLAENVYMQILTHARDYVYITTPYLILDNEMLSALCLAAQSGVDVRIITPHVPDKWYVHMVTRSYYQQLLSAGVRIFEYTPGFIHAKMFVSDNTTAVVGTTNVDFRSFYLHFECGVAFYLSPMVAQVRDDILKPQNICEEITLQKVRAVRAPIRVLRSLLRAFAPLM